MTQNSTIKDDLALSAYLDGELPQDEADRISARLASEPALLRRLEAMRGGDDATRQLFAKLDELPMPQRVLDLLNDRPQSSVDDKVVAFPARFARQYFQLPVALAASVALLAGFLISGVVRDTGGGAGDFRVLASGEIAAGSALHERLESGVSTAPQTSAGGFRSQLLLTFEDVSGDYCRQLRIATDVRSAQALACRRAGRWQLETLDFEDGLVPGGQYQQASGPGSAVLDAAIDALIGDNEPLDAGDESRLVNNGWKKID
jgi:hypothetical protein